MQITKNIEYKNMMKVQELVKKYNWRFEYCIKNKKNMRICINSNGNKNENIKKFCQSLYGMEKIYKETFRKYSILKKIKISLKKLYNSITK